MARKQSSRAIDILAAAANDEDSGSGSESKNLPGSDPDSPNPIEENSPNRKSSRKRSLPKNRLLDESPHSSKNARVGSIGSVNRLWSEQDVIGILQGMIDFRAQKGLDPCSNMNVFLEFVQDLLNVHVSRKQLVDKIRRLRNKYLANAEIGNVGLEKPHDCRVFELSEIIWGGDGNVVENGTNGNVVVDDEVEGGDVDVVENGVEVEVQVQVGDDDKDEGKDFEEMYPYLSKGWESDAFCSPLMKNYLMDNIRLVGSDKLREMDKKWKNTYVEQLKLYVKRLDLLKEHAQLVLDQMATSDS